MRRRNTPLIRRSCSVRFESRRRTNQRRCRCWDSGRPPLVRRADVLGLVDPLAAAAPDQGCVLRDADLANRALVTRGSSVDLEELGGIGVGLGAACTAPTVIRAVPARLPGRRRRRSVAWSRRPGRSSITALPEHVSLYTAELRAADRRAHRARAAAPARHQRRGARRRPARRRQRRADAGARCPGGRDRRAAAVRIDALRSAARCPPTRPPKALLVIPRSLLAHLQAPDAAGGAVRCRWRWRAGSRRAKRLLTRGDAHLDRGPLGAGRGAAPVNGTPRDTRKHPRANHRSSR